ncbi:hypothetical protein DH2020_026910 [Rehmannia glutinosa]|uniref:Dof-type domain-containing protein n=1 Tax=Rehmannia glutinosa TaxID=99300 RepID=A0ABR0VYJ9_REHGL
MSEVMKDSSIKLFGKTIAFKLGDEVVSDVTVTEQRQSSSDASTSQDSKDISIGEFRNEYESTDPSEETLTEEDSLSEKPPKEDDEPSESSDSQDKSTLKKPDKILPCPRCKSMDTKFCYYNNYNVKQPRHFCKNCQRYWTCGGTMRNVPVGSGRRKNKNNAVVPDYRHIMVLDNALQETKPNGFVMFGSDRPICDQNMSSTLNLANRSQQNCVPNEFYGHSLGFPVNFYPATTYWGSSLQNPWNNVSWVSSNSSSSPTSTLGKHSREETLSKKISAERSSVLIPKTLRIGDPNEAAKSSIWSTLGIKNEKIGSTYKTCPFKAFESKGDRNRSIDNATMVLQANPAALSRSLNFHESA